MATNSREKGKVGEREVAALIRQLFPGTEARRGQQYAGSNGDADVVGLEGVHVEVKRRHSSLDGWMKQAVEDAKQGAVPTVWHRGNRCGWLVTVRATQLVTLAMLVMDLDKETEKPF